MQSKDYYRKLPTKRMGSGALFFDLEEKILIVKPNYSDFWEIPGGVVEKNESPKKTAEREIKEELGLDKYLSELLCVDYQNSNSDRTESLMFIFNGGLLLSSEIDQIKLDLKELKEYKFVNISLACELLHPNVAKRVKQAIIARDKEIALYLEEGELLIE